MIPEWQAHVTSGEDGLGHEEGAVVCQAGRRGVDIHVVSCGDETEMEETYKGGVL